MATSVQSVSPQMRHYLSSCSPQELHAILQTIQGSQLTQSPPPNVMHNTQLQVAQPTQIAKVSKRKTTKVSVAKLKKRTRTRGGPFTTPATRPLNSYMAFRSYYSPMFSSQQQKDISGFLRDLWQHDPFKAKWTILAKAYSVIRDYKGKDLAPLDVFLGITAPHIGLIAPDSYLSSLGWQFVVNDGVKRMNRCFEPGPASFSDHLRTTILSVDDILHHCCEVGYVIDNEIEDMDNSATTPGMTTLTMATRPTSVQGMWTPGTYQLGLPNAQTSMIPGLQGSRSSSVATSAQTPLTADSNKAFSLASSNTVYTSSSVNSPGTASQTQHQSNLPVAGLGISQSSGLPRMESDLPGMDSSSMAIAAGQVEGAYARETSESVADTMAFFGYDGVSTNEYAQGVSMKEIEAFTDTDYSSVDPQLAFAVAQLQYSNQEFPFTEQFDPTNNFELSFDPSFGDEYNSFNVSSHDDGGAYFSSNFFDLDTTEYSLP